MGSDGAAKGVVLKDGTEIHSKVVLSNATPHVTFKHIVPQVMKNNVQYITCNYGTKLHDLFRVSVFTVGCPFPRVHHSYRSDRLYVASYEDQR